MKSRSKFFIGLSLILQLQMAFSVTTVWARGQDVGNGGAGVIRDGKVGTFATMGARVLGLSDSRTLPGMELLIDTLGLMPDFASVLPLRDAIAPSASRVYVIANESDVPPAALERCRTMYGTSVRLERPSDQLVLFACTVGRRTYLLPPYFGLDEIQQTTILFHEGLWAAAPDLKPELVLAAEMAFENYLRFGLNHMRWGYMPRFFEALDRIASSAPWNQGPAALSLPLSLQEDMAKGTLKKLLTPLGIPFSALFSETGLISPPNPNWSPCSRINTGRAAARLGETNSSLDYSHFIQVLIKNRMFAQICLRSDTRESRFEDLLVYHPAMGGSDTSLERLGRLWPHFMDVLRSSLTLLNKNGEVIGYIRFSAP